MPKKLITQCFKDSYPNATGIIDIGLKKAYFTEKYFAMLETVKYGNNF